MRERPPSDPLDPVLITVGQARDVAGGIAKDVDTHSSEMTRISDETKRLGGPDAAGVAKPVLALIGRAVIANERLKARIAEAEQRLRNQADELADYQREARTDFLTGLSNRRVFDRELDRCFDQWQRLDMPFSLMLVDLDGFKSLNGEHSRNVGDKLLRRAGDLLTRTLRNLDVPCRYGGDEFAVILPNTAFEGAQNAAERLRQAIEAMQFAYQEQQIQVTASIGLAGVLLGDDSVSLLRRADNALRTAKQAGGNGSHVHDGTELRRIVTRAPSKPRFSTERDMSRNVQPGFLFTLPDRGRFECALTRHVTESHEHAIPLSVMFVEVDGMAQVGEDHGQAIADLVLDEVARRLQQAIRSTDLLFWEEDGPFAIVLPGSTAAEAGLVATRIKEACSGAQVPNGDLAGPVSLRVGFASCQAEDDLESLCERAELKLQCERPAVLV